MISASAPLVFGHSEPPQTTFTSRSTAFLHTMCEHILLFSIFSVAPCVNIAERTFHHGIGSTSEWCSSCQRSASCVRGGRIGAKYIGRAWPRALIGKTKPRPTMPAGVRKTRQLRITRTAKQLANLLPAATDILVARWFQRTSSPKAESVAEGPQYDLLRRIFYCLSSTQTRYACLGKQLPILDCQQG